MYRFLGEPNNYTLAAMADRYYIGNVVWVEYSGRLVRAYIIDAYVKHDKWGNKTYMYRALPQHHDGKRFNKLFIKVTGEDINRAYKLAAERTIPA